MNAAAEIAAKNGRWSDLRQGYIFPANVKIPDGAVEVYRANRVVAYEINGAYWYRFNGRGTTETSEVVFFPDKEKCPMYWARQLCGSLSA